MVTTREITGTKAQIAEQIGNMSGRIVSAIIIIDESPIAESAPPSDAEFSHLMDQLQTLAVDTPLIDYSREAMYTRMSGE